MKGDRMEEENEVIRYIILGFAVVVVGWLIYTHTGHEANQISPDFWAGAFLGLLLPIARKAFNLTKPKIEDKGN